MLFNSLFASFIWWKLKSSFNFFAGSSLLSDFASIIIFLFYSESTHIEEFTANVVYFSWQPFFHPPTTNFSVVKTNWIMELNELSKQVFRTSCRNNRKQFAGTETYHSRFGPLLLLLFLFLRLLAEEIR